MLYTARHRLGRYLQRRAVRFWRKAAQQVKTRNPSELPRELVHAQKMQRQVAAFRLEAEARLHAPDGEKIDTPPGTDWSWRPRPWRGPIDPPTYAPAKSQDRLSDDIVIFHDDPNPTVTAAQRRNICKFDYSIHQLAIEAFQFDGSFLSLVVELPKDAAHGICKDHVFRLACNYRAEHPTTLSARLNIRNGPNTDQILTPLPANDETSVAEFDLAYSGVNENRVEAIWIDILIENPSMNCITFTDLTVCRLIRAAV